MATKEQFSKVIDKLYEIRESCWDKPPSPEDYEEWGRWLKSNILTLTFLLPDIRYPEGLSFTEAINLAKCAGAPIIKPVEMDHKGLRWRVLPCTCCGGLWDLETNDWAKVSVDYFRYTWELFPETAHDGQAERWAEDYKAGKPLNGYNPLENGWEIKEIRNSEVHNSNPKIAFVKLQKTIWPQLDVEKQEFIDDAEGCEPFAKEICNYIGDKDA